MSLRNYDTAPDIAARTPRGPIRFHDEIGDADLAEARRFNRRPAGEAGGADGRTATTNASVHSVFVTGPGKKIAPMTTCPLTTRRSFDGIVCVRDSMQMAARHKVATPLNRNRGDDDKAVCAPQAWMAPTPCMIIVRHPS